MEAVFKRHFAFAFIRISFVVGMAGLTAAPVTMAKIDPHSSVTAKEELDLFKTPATETSELASSFISTQPLSLSDNSSEFTCEIAASPDCATDLKNSFFVAKVKFTKSDGTDLKALGDAQLNVFPDNNLAHSMFDRLTVSLNGVETFHTGEYAQNAYHHCLLLEKESVKKGKLSVAGWFSDKDNGNDEADVSAEGKASRKKYTASSVSRTLAFVPILPLSGKDSRRVPPNTSIRVTLHRAPIRTFMMSSDAGEDVVMKIESLEFHVRRCALNPAVLRAFTSRLVEGGKYQMPVMRRRTRKFAVPRGVSEYRALIQSNDFLPQQLIAAIVPQKAMSGDFKLSQFRYRAHGVNYFELTRDGNTVDRPIKCDVENGDAAHAYGHTLVALGMMDEVESNGISYEDFCDNKFLMAWSFDDVPTEDWGKVFHIKKKGTLELFIRFARATTETLTLVVTDTREDLVKLDLENRVTTTGSVV